MSEEEFAPFWMVYGLGQGSPTYRHATEERALAEASRLASTHPGIKFCVLASTFVVEKKTITTKKLVGGKFVDFDAEDDRIPF